MNTVGKFQKFKKHILVPKFQPVRPKLTIGCAYQESHIKMASAEEWKQVPPACVFGIETLWATKYGQVRSGTRILHGYKNAKGTHGHYKSCCIKGHTLYLHRLVYFAHSGKSAKELLAGSVIFREAADPATILDENGCYRSWFEDIVFVPSPHSVRDAVIPSEVEVAAHPKYGAVRFNEWLSLFTLPRGETRMPVKSELYEICLLNNPTTPCVIRNKARGRIMNIRTNKGHDPAIGLKPSASDATVNYQLTHILLASAFPTQQALYTADHLNDDSKNNCVLNLQWMTNTENCRKAQAKTAEKRRAAAAAGRPAKTPCVDLPDEIWKPLTLTDYSAEIYLVSNRARIKNKASGLVLGAKTIRGRKYTCHTIAIEKNKYKTFNTHYIVYRSFHGEVPAGMDILHNDAAPLTAEGTYRNWAEDFRLGPRSANISEFHTARRCAAAAPDTIQHI